MCGGCEHPPALLMSALTLHKHFQLLTADKLMISWDSAVTDLLLRGGFYFDEVPSVQTQHQTYEFQLRCVEDMFSLCCHCSIDVCIFSSGFISEVWSERRFSGSLSSSWGKQRWVSNFTSVELICCTETFTLAVIFLLWAYLLNFISFINVTIISYIHIPMSVFLLVAMTFVVVTTMFTWSCFISLRFFLLLDCVSACRKADVCTRSSSNIIQDLRLEKLY